MGTKDLPGSGRAATTAGLTAAVACFLLWGIANPVYFKAVSYLDPLEILAHRVLWTVVLLAAFVGATTGIGGVVRAVGSWRRMGIFAVTTALISVNWGVFIWAVQQNRLVETSLGYYVNPLVNVLLGLAFLGERLTARQGAAVALAAVGVSVLVVAHGTLPWVALALALTFGLYGLLRKIAVIEPTVGLLVETALLLPAAAAYLLWLGPAGSFAAGAPVTDLLLIVAGPMTAVPMVLFVYAAQRLKLTTVGLLQYIGPTGQLLLATLVFGETFGHAHAAAFAFIWAGLVVFSLDAWTTRRAALRPAPAGE